MSDATAGARGSNSKLGRKPKIDPSLLTKDKTYPASYEAWLQYNQSNFYALCSCLEELIRTNRSEFSQKNLAASIGKHESFLSKIKNESFNWQSLGSSTYTNIVTYLFQKKLLLGLDNSSIEDPLAIYRGFSNFLSMTSEDLDLAKKCLVGNYTAFRLSSYLYGKFVLKGYMTVTASEDGSALKTFERFRVTSESAEKEKNYIRQGYLFLRNKMPIIVSRNVQSDDLQLIVMQNISLRPSNLYEKPVDNMDGPIFHIQDNEIYSTRIVLIRTDKIEFTESDLCVEHPSEIKPDVANALQRGINNVGDYLFRFT